MQVRGNFSIVLNDDGIVTKVFNNSIVLVKSLKIKKKYYFQKVYDDLFALCEKVIYDIAKSPGK